MTLSEKFVWRKACRSDAAAMADIYNETAAIGGHSPVLGICDTAGMINLLKRLRRHSCPVWVVEFDSRVVAFVFVGLLAWGPQICHRTGDLSIYISREWQGRALPLQMLLTGYEEILLYGFTAITCWILSCNRPSLAVARAFHLQRWGLLPRAACVGDVEVDVEIWGTRLDDPQWCDHMKELRLRYESRRDLRAAAETLSCA